jgi:hypothetical protein
MIRPRILLTSLVVVAALVAVPAMFCPSGKPVHFDRAAIPTQD